MDVKELVGWFLALVAVSGGIAAIAAARYFTHRKIYERQLRRERRARRERQQ